LQFESDHGPEIRGCVHTIFHRLPSGHFTDIAPGHSGDQVHVKGGLLALKLRGYPSRWSPHEFTWSCRAHAVQVRDAGDLSATGRATSGREGMRWSGLASALARPPRKFAKLRASAAAQCRLLFGGCSRSPRSLATRAQWMLLRLHADRRLRSAGRSVWRCERRVGASGRPALTIAGATAIRTRTQTGACTVSGGPPFSSVRG